jgi:hypothetical protein
VLGSAAAETAAAQDVSVNSISVSAFRCNHVATAQAAGRRSIAFGLGPLNERHELDNVHESHKRDETGSQAPSKEPLCGFSLTSSWKELCLGVGLEVGRLGN